MYDVFSTFTHSIWLEMTVVKGLINPFTNSVCLPIEEWMMLTFPLSSLSSSRTFFQV